MYIRIYSAKSLIWKKIRENNYDSHCTRTTTAKNEIIHKIVVIQKIREINANLQVDFMEVSGKKEHYFYIF